MSSLIGRAGLIRPDIVARPRPRATLSRPPRQFETAIEAPYRLVISPSARAGWTHATEPVGAEGAPHRIELWHTRLGVRVEDDERVSVDERRNTQRVVRALWARDREGPELFEGALGGITFPNWQSLKWPGRVDKPFRSSLDPGDRHMLVRQSAESWLDAHKKPIPPEPVDVEGLWLSALGAWLDLHGEWNTDPYSENEIRSILLWDHVAPLGRDQFVRVVYPGYLFPFGHKTSLVKLTERKMKDAAPSVAGLYQQKFLLVGQPRRSYARRNFPFDELGVTPLVTPTLDNDPDPSNPFIPRVSNAPFNWVLHCVDKEQRPVRLVTPLIWVPAGYPNLPAVVALYHSSGIDKVAADGQDIAYAEVSKGGDTVVATVQLHFDGEPEKVKSEPLLMDASVELPAIQRLSPIGPVTIEYSDIYLANGFQSAKNVAEVWAELPTPPKLSFGQGSAAGSDKAGGFLQPNLEVAGPLPRQGDDRRRCRDGEGEVQAGGIPRQRVSEAVRPGLARRRARDSRRRPGRCARRRVGGAGPDRRLRRRSRTGEEGGAGRGRRGQPARRRERSRRRPSSSSRPSRPSRPRSSSRPPSLPRSTTS